MADKHYVGEIGTEIVLDTSVDLTAGMSPKIKVKKPDGTTAEWAATVKSTTKMPYIIQALDFSVAGVYAFQASITIGGWTGLGETAYLRVYDPYG